MLRVQIVATALFVMLVNVTAQQYCFDNKSCHSDFFSKTVCCGEDNKCHLNCIGRSCAFNSDCGGSEEYCCNDVCQEGNCVLAGWIVAVIVISVLGIVGAVLGVVLCFFCSYRRRHYAGLVVEEATHVPTTTTSTVNSACVVQEDIYPIVQPVAPCYGRSPPLPPPYYTKHN